MEKIKHGGAAFPFQAKAQNGSPWAPEYGMSLRDYFAGQALVGLTSTTNSEGEWQYGSPLNVAEVSYKIADAMIKERENKKEDINV